jgi:hypothetical protein
MTQRPCVRFCPRGMRIIAGFSSCSNQWALGDQLEARPALEYGVLSARVRVTLLGCNAAGTAPVTGDA